MFFPPQLCLIWIGCDCNRVPLPLLQGYIPVCFSSFSSKMNRIECAEKRLFGFLVVIHIYINMPKFPFKVYCWLINYICWLNHHVCWLDHLSCWLNHKITVFVREATFLVGSIPTTVGQIRIWCSPPSLLLKSLNPWISLVKCYPHYCYPTIVG